MLRHWFPPGFSRAFWILFGGRLLNAVGTSLFFPFLTVFLHARLGISLTAVGAVLLLLAACQSVVLLFGGRLVDRFGRLPAIIVSLVAGGLLTVVAGLATAAPVIVAAIALRAMALVLANPASQALIADLVPAPRLLEAFSLARVATNTGIIIGPMLGAFLVSQSFTVLFLVSGVLMVAFAIGMGLLLGRESLPRLGTKTIERGLRHMLQVERPLYPFAAITALMYLVYSQLYWVLPGYLVLHLRAPAADFGFLAAENALFVILLQVPLSRLVANIRLERVLAAGMIAYAIGFGSMGLWHQVWPFALSVLVITIGENLVNPSVTTWATLVSSPDHRGQALSLVSLANQVGSGAGPLAGGFALDQGGVWGLWGSIASLSALSAALFDRVSGRSHTQAT